MTVTYRVWQACIAAIETVHGDREATVDVVENLMEQVEAIETEYKTWKLVDDP